MSSPERRVALITCGTDGIGKATARRLLRDGWAVVFVGRSPERCAATFDELRAATGGDVAAIVADLSLLGETRRAADEFAAAHDRLDLLLLNANAIVQERRVTAEGSSGTLPSSTCRGRSWPGASSRSSRRRRRPRSSQSSASTPRRSTRPTSRSSGETSAA